MDAKGKKVVIGAGGEVALVALSAAELAERAAEDQAHADSLNVAPPKSLVERVAALEAKG